MLTSNFTEVTVQQDLWQTCSADLTGELHVHLLCLTVLNVFFSIATILGNTLILVALHNESSLHPPSKLLLRCLATTDVCVGLMAQPVCVVYWISTVRQNWNVCRYSSMLRFAISYLLGSVSLLTLTAISVDRLLALLLGLRYRQVITLKRTSVIITVIWVVSTSVAIVSWWKHGITTWYGYIGISLCLVTSTCTYTTIFWRLRQHQTQLHVQGSDASPLNMTRYKKAVSTALWLQLTLIACYLPYQITDVIYNRYDLTPSVFLAAQFTITLVYLNSLLNPILYCWKIREVRQAVKEILRKLCC